MIKAIIFDCFGVLTDDAWHAFRMSLPEEQGRRAHDLNRAYCAGLISHGEFLHQVAEVTGHPEAEIAWVLKNESNKNFPLLQYIATLKPHYKIGLLSNVASGWVRDKFLTPDEQKLFDDMVFSFEVGATKPEPEIYQLAAKRLGVQLADCVMIDDIERYSEAAQAVGMQAVTYHDLNQMKTELEKLLLN